MYLFLANLLFISIIHDLFFRLLVRLLACLDIVSHLVIQLMGVCGLNNIRITRSHDTGLIPMHVHSLVRLKPRTEAPDLAATQGLSAN